MWRTATLLSRGGGGGAQFGQNRSNQKKTYRDVRARERRLLKPHMGSVAQYDMPVMRMEKQASFGFDNPRK